MTRYKLIFGILILLIAIVTSCKTNAQSNDKKQKNQGPPSVEELFKTMDKNEDGLLSKEEVKGTLKNDFAKIDLNDDGFLSEAELEKAPKPERRERPKKRK